MDQIGLIFAILVTLLAYVGQSLSLEQGNSSYTSEDGLKRAKALSVFQVVRFPNSPCVGTSSYNGTCFTSSECASKSGTAAGTCANGFGVCCTFVVGCGKTISQNSTYFESTQSTGGSCVATICKCSPDICQLRLDFNTFVITGPTTDLTLGLTQTLFGAPVTPVVTTPAPAIAAQPGAPVSLATQCLTDSFSVTSPGNSAPPIICGTNTNQHMYVQASDACNSLAFQFGTANLGATVPVPRKWSIKITQISCLDTNFLAPPGCTQYYTSATGTFQSYNFGATNPSLLANQNQKICFRQGLGKCRICYFTAGAADFAVSGLAGGMAGGKNTGTICCAFGPSGLMMSGFDCLMIPGASNKAKVMRPNGFCGSAGLLTRSLAANVVTRTLATVCSMQSPFEVSFNSDPFTPLTSAVMKGFKLMYEQLDCTT